MRACWLWAAAIAVLATFVQPDTAFAEKRMALVIGNANYTSFAPVKTAEKDAADIGAVLNQAGFEVVVALNLVGEIMKRVIPEFSERLQDADLVVVYFVGQAIEINDTSYLMPIDAPNASRKAAIDSAITLSAIVKSVPARAKMVVFLDAARTDPFTTAEETAKDSVNDLFDQRSLLYVIYSTAPGTGLAPFDGRNSAFATALLRRIRLPFFPLSEIDKAVRVETNILTERRQTPFSRSAGKGDVVFFSAPR